MWLLAPEHQQRATQGAHVSSASEEVRIPTEEQTDEDAFTPVASDPCDYATAGEESPDSDSGPDDDDAPASVRSAVLAKAAARPDWTGPSAPLSPPSSRPSSRAPSRQSFAPCSELSDARRQRMQSVLQSSMTRSSSSSAGDVGAPLPKRVGAEMLRHNSDLKQNNAEATISA